MPAQKANRSLDTGVTHFSRAGVVRAQYSQVYAGFDKPASRILHAGNLFRISERKA
jgi:hypothetical protein